MHKPLHWKACRLLPAIQNVFTSSTYPAPNRAGNLYAFYAVLPTYPPRVALSTPTMNPHHVKLLTLQLAATGLEDIPVGTKVPIDREALAALEAHPGVIYSYLNVSRSHRNDEDDEV